MVVRARHLGLDDALGDLERALVAAQDFGVVPAAVDHLHVVHRDDGQPVVDGVEVAPALEVADDHVGAEAVGDVEVRLDVAGPAAGDGALEVLEQRAEVFDLVVLGDDGEAPDLLHRQVLAGALGQVVVGAARDHHLHVVVLHQLVEDDARADGVAHAFADDPVEDAHGAQLTRFARGPAACAAAAPRQKSPRRAAALHRRRGAIRSWRAARRGRRPCAPRPPRA